MSKWGIATCPKCGTPLVSTLAWRHYEFYCIECGSHWGFLSPVGVPETPESEARLAEVEADWKVLHAGLSVEGHVRPEQEEAHAAALTRIAARVRSKVLHG